jgi:cysteine-rich repeat protein
MHHRSRRLLVSVPLACRGALLSTVLLGVLAAATPAIAQTCLSDPDTAKCQITVAKALGKAAACLFKCEIARATGKLADAAAEDACENTAPSKSCKAKYDHATNAESKINAICPSCLDAVRRAEMFEEEQARVDEVSSELFCCVIATTTTTISTTSTTLAGIVCGNGIVQAGEQCDDGNVVALDGCDSTCQFEPGDTVGNCSADSGPAQIVSAGTSQNVILRGCIVTPTVSFTGEVLVVGDSLACVAADCSAAAGAATATVVNTHGIVLPGLVDAHNHISFDIFDETDWSPQQTYTNHNQWPSEARYGAMVDAKQYLSGEASSPVDLACEMNKYGELKGLIAGTTSIVGAANPANRACYGSLPRTIDQSPNDLAQDKVQLATLFPTTASANAVCANIADDSTDAFLVHIGEGVDASALNEFQALSTITTTDGCLYATETAIVEGTALGSAEFDTMAANGMSLIWSPRSNVFLYGGGSDLTKTTNIPLARSKGIHVAIGPNWSLGGSQNLLDELRFANKVDDTVWGDVLTDKDLVSMATENGAEALGLSATLGSLAAGRKADLFVIGGNTAYPWNAVLTARPSDVRLVMVNGVALYGDHEVEALGPASPGCEALDVCGTPKFVCVAENGGTASNKLGQTFTQIATALSTELASYDALNLTQWKFAPVTPLVRCP